MKLISWNVRGLNIPRKYKMIKIMIQQESVGNMMQSVVLDGNLLDEVVLDGNLLDELRGRLLAM